jgi:hypothetical protein
MPHRWPARSLRAWDGDPIWRTQTLQRVAVEHPQDAAQLHAECRVADITILSQAMLTMMSEPTLRKLLIFADSRQEAAFQAGWMQERAKRFRLRHLAYRLVAEREDQPWGWSGFVDEIIGSAQNEGILPRRDFDNIEQQTEVRWF